MTQQHIDLTGNEHRDAERAKIEANFRQLRSAPR